MIANEPLPGPFPRQGFTVLELVTALALMALVLAAAARLLMQMSDFHDRMHAQATDDATQMNGMRWLRSVVSRAEASADSTLRFTGSAVEATLATSCAVPAGWLERCRVVLTLANDGDSVGLWLSVDSAHAIRVWSETGRAEFRFRDDATRGGVWRRRWDDELITPSAIALVGAGDTLVLPISGR